MKKMVLGLSLSLAALAFLMPPPMAAAAPQGVPALSLADQAFLASLAVPAANPAAKRPQIGAKSLCSATANCANGGTVSCSGNSSTTSCSAVDGNCSVGEPGHVTCDGVTTTCSACPADCDDLEFQCEESCSPCTVRFFQCSPYRCRCNLTLNCA